MVIIIGNLMTTPEKTGERPWSFQSGHIALDFANTADWHASQQPEELLNSYIDLVNWCHDFDILNKRLSDDLLREAAKHPHKAAAALDKGRHLRDAIYRIFAAVSAQSQPDKADLDHLKLSYAEAATAAKIKPEQHGFTLTWIHEPPAFEQMLCPVSFAALDLLLSADLAKVGQCADDRGCGLLFIDTSRNHSRSWCRMETCGNRAKAQRHYRRNRPNA